MGCSLQEQCCALSGEGYGYMQISKLLGVSGAAVRYALQDPNTYGRVVPNRQRPVTTSTPGVTGGNRLNHAELRVTIATLRKRDRLQDIEIARQLGIDSLTVRRIAGARKAALPRPKLPCQPCIACGKPLFLTGNTAWNGLRCYQCATGRSRRIRRGTLTWSTPTHASAQPESRLAHTRVSPSKELEAA